MLPIVGRVNSPEGAQKLGVSGTIATVNLRTDNLGGLIRLPPYLTVQLSYWRRV